MQKHLSQLAQKFKAFARVESQAMSPFYSALSERIWKDNDVLAIASNVSPGQPPPNVLFAVVLFLLSRGTDAELLARYPPHWSPDDSDATSSRFRKLILQNAAEIIPILQTRRVQSNVVRRATVLALGMHHARRAIGDGPLSNLEIGCSLGLTLLWQRFHCVYGPELSMGGANSSLRIATEMTREPLPTEFTELPFVDESVGIEYELVEADDPDAIDRLEALIWPNHQDNLLLSRAALEVLRSEPPTIHNGDAAIAIPRVVATLPTESVICVYHSHTWNQMHQPTRDRIDSHLKGRSVNRPVVQLSFEGAAEHSLLTLLRYPNGNKLKPKSLAECEAHSRWINYLGENGV